MRDRLLSAETQKLGRARERFVALTASLEAMSPLRVLTRGYSIASGENGACIRSVAELAPGDSLRLRLSDGSADCRVLDIKRSSV
jgi:exodeoxyribonuclease VII large subunit